MADITILDFDKEGALDPPTESKISTSQSFEAVYLDTDSV
jgi:hypothetical protein